MKKLFYLILILIIELLFLQNVKAENDLIYWGLKQENNDKWTLKISNHNISTEYSKNGSFNSNDVFNLDTIPWKEKQSNIYYIQIGEENDIIRPKNTAYWFYNIKNISSLNFDYLDTSNVINMSNMFANMIGLKSLDLSKFNTSNVTNMNNMFGRCTNLEELNLKNFDTSKVTNMSYMFSGCSNLEELDLSSFDTSEVIDMSSMFYQSGIKSINLSSFDTSKVTNMSYMFSRCINLEELDLTNFNTSKVTNMKSIVVYNNKLKKLNMSNFDLTNITQTTLESIISNLSSLEELDLTGWNLSNFTSTKLLLSDGPNSNNLKKLNFNNVIFGENVSQIFSQLKNLEEINLNNVNTSKVTNMSDMFSGCNNLKEINLSSFDTSKVTNMSGMFRGCNSLKEINLSNFDTSEVIDMNYMFSGCSNLNELDLSNFDTSKVTNMSGIFSECNNLKELNLSNFDTSKVTNMSYMFSGCNNLKEINLSNFDTSKVTNMSYMFSGCSNLNELDLSKFDTSKVTNMSGMFRECNNLKELNLSNFDTSEVIDMSFMFLNCSSLNELDLSNFDTSEVIDMSYMFSKCSNLNELDLSNFDTSKVTGMSYMFSECSNLKEINLSSFDTSKVTNMEFMFYKCSKLSYLDLRSFNISNVTRMDYVFSNCSYLSTIVVSDDWNYNAYDIYPFKDSENIIGMNGTKCNYTTSRNMVIDQEENPGCLWNYLPEIIYWRVEGENCTKLGNTCKLIIGNHRVDGTFYDKGFFSTAGVPNWFDYSGVSEIVFEDGENKIKPYSMEKWFYNFKKINSISLKNIDGSNLNSINELFYGCESLENVDFEDFDTTNVKYMSGVFNNCKNLEEIDLSNFNTLNVVDMSYMFNNCTKIKKLSMNNFKTSKVKSFMFMFDNCTSLEEVDISNWDFSSYIYNATDYDKLFGYELYNLYKVTMKNVKFGISTKYFFSNGNIKYIDLENVNTSSVVDMSDMFSGCSNLKELDLSSFDTSNVENMSNMFANCSSLKLLDLSKFNISKTNNFNNMFSRCNKLNMIAVSDSWMIDYTNNNITADNMFYNDTLLFGMNGTKYNLNNIDKEYARIDTKDFPGYFWDKVDLTQLDLSGINNLKISNDGNKIKLNWDEDIYSLGYEIYRSIDSKKWTKIKVINSNSITSFNDSNLTYGKTYFYKIQSFNNTKRSGFSTIVSKKVVPNKVKLSIASASTNNVKLSWDKVNTTGYEVYMNGKKITTITKNGTLTYNKTKLKANTTYKFKVRAYKTVSKKKIYGPFSTTISVKTAPVKPSLSLSLKTLTEMNIKIGSVNGASKYTVQKSLDGKTYELLEDLTGAKTLVANELEIGKTYYYRVRACNTQDRCSGWVTKSLKQTTKTPSYSLKTTSKKVTITLKSVEGADGYEIHRATKKKGKYTKVKELTSESELVYNNKTKKGTTYYYKVRSYKMVDGEKVYSPFSSIKSIKSK